MLWKKIDLRFIHPGRGALIHSKNFSLLFLSTLTVSFGQTFFLLVVAISVFESSDSNMLSGLVFAFQWISAVLMAAFMVFLIGKFGTVKLLIASLVFTGAFSFLAALCSSGSIWIVLFLVGLRSLPEAIFKSVRVYAIKEHVDSNILSRALPTTHLGLSFGAATGALSVIFLSDASDIKLAAMVDMLCLSSAAILIAFLKIGDHLNLNPANTAELPTFSAYGVIRNSGLENRQIFLSVIYMLVSVCLLVGYHNIYRVSLPVKYLGLGPDGAVILQAIATVAFLVGGLFVAALPKSSNALTNSASASCIAGLVSLVIVGHISHPLVALTFYAAMLFFSETAFVVAQRDIMTSANALQSKYLAAFLPAIRAVFTVTVIVVGGWVSERISLSSFSLGIAFLGAAIIALSTLERFAFSWLHNRRH